MIQLQIPIIISFFQKSFGTSQKYIIFIRTKTEN